MYFPFLLLFLLLPLFLLFYIWLFLLFLLFHVPPPSPSSISPPPQSSGVYESITKLRSTSHVRDSTKDTFRGGGGSWGDRANIQETVAGVGAIGWAYRRRWRGLKRSCGHTGDASDSWGDRADMQKTLKGFGPIGHKYRRRWRACRRRWRWLERSWGHTKDAGGGWSDRGDTYDIQKTVRAAHMENVRLW